jgi:quercetin dioxygenase-like cupin family protein
MEEISMGSQPALFDESLVTWYKLDWLEHVEFHVYKIDEANRIVDILFKFAPNQKAALHQHYADYVTFVVQGELRLYNKDGELKELRPTGSYVSGSAMSEPHTEGGGDQEAIVFFSNRNVQDVLYRFLDDDLNPIRDLRFEDFKAQFEAQGQPVWQKTAA